MRHAALVVQLLQQNVLTVRVDYVGRVAHHWVLVVGAGWAVVQVAFLDAQFVHLLPVGACFVGVVAAAVMVSTFVSWAYVSHSVCTIYTSSVGYKIIALCMNRSTTESKRKSFALVLSNTESK